MGISCSCGCAAQYSSSMSRSSCALPSAKTGMRHLPPLATTSCTVEVNLPSRSSLFSWMWMP